MPDDRDVRAMCHSLRVNGNADRNEIISFLHASECTIIESMRILVEEYGIPLREAKSEVTAHPLWSEVVEAAKPLHDDLYRMASNRNDIEGHWGELPEDS